MVGRRGDGEVPDYRHAPAAVVPLAFPFCLSGRLIASLALSPPTLDDLIHLRSAAGLDARDLLSAMSGLPAPAIGALRWPDVEVALTAGMDLLPPDLVARMEGGGDTEAVAGDAPVPPADRRDLPVAAEPETGGADVAASFGALDPAEYIREV